MTIAELFVKLGFQLEGDEELDKTIGGLEKAATNAGKAALGIDLVTGAMIALVSTAVNAAVGFQKFALSTGLSTTELQQWEHTAALGNVTASELQQSVKGIQAASAQIALGNGNTSPWVLLGINPHQDPFSILRQLHEALQNITPERLGMARVIAQQAGISENMFQLLRQKNLPIDSLKEMYILTADNQRELVRLNIEWQNLTDTTDRLKNKFAAALALSALEVVVGWLQQGVDLLGKFVQWLDSGSVEADAVKVGISTLAAALVILSGAITVVTGAIAALTVGMIALEFATPIAGFVALTTAILATVGAITKLVSIYEDWKRAERVANGDLSAELVDPGLRRAKLDWQRLHAGDTGALTDLLSRPVERGGSGTTVQQTNHIEINGAGDPAAVAGATVDKLKQQLAHATYTGEALSR